MIPGTLSSPLTRTAIEFAVCEWLVTAISGSLIKPTIDSAGSELHLSLMVDF